VLGSFQLTISCVILNSGDDESTLTPARCNIICACFEYEESQVGNERRLHVGVFVCVALSLTLCLLH
jgi:hypothetical protein